MRSLSLGSSSSRGVSHGVRLVQPLEASWYPSGQVEDVALADLHVLGRREDLVDVPAVVVAGADDALDAAALELRVGPLDPFLDRLAHLLVEQLLELVLVARVLVALLGRQGDGVVAVVLDETLGLGEVVRAVELVRDVEHVVAPLLGTGLDDRDDRLAGHVPTEDEDVGLVVLGRVDELAPADLRAMDVRGEEEPYLHAVPPFAAYAGRLVTVPPATAGSRGRPRPSRRARCAPYPIPCSRSRCARRCAGSSPTRPTTRPRAPCRA